MQDSDRARYAKALEKVLIFKYLDAEDRAWILDHAEVAVYADGICLIKEGEITQYLYVVLEGAANVGVRRDGRDVYISLIGAGETVGEAGLFMNVKRTASVVACGRTVVFRLNREVFLNFVNNHPRGGSRVLLVIIYGLLKKLRESNQELAFERKSDIGQEDIDDMVTQLLLGAASGQ
jgi:CRP-like cAMP-binding protein